MEKIEKKQKRITVEFEKDNDIIWLIPVIGVGVNPDKAEFGIAFVWFKMMFQITVCYKLNTVSKDEN
jgi:hypothetical protein